MNNKFKITTWFTLVELIVVVTILSILSTIWFVSYSSYLAWVRDTNRISQLKAIWDALHLYETKKSLPLPDEKRIDIKYWANKIATQWYIWKSVIETIWYTSEGLDPKDKTYFSYYLTKNRKYFQLLAFLEEESEITSSKFNNSSNTKSLLLGERLVHAVVDYENRYPYVEWKKLWILLTDKNEPVQEIHTGSLDISNVSKTYKSYLKYDEFIKWTWDVFKDLWKIAKVWWRGYSVSGSTLAYKNLDWDSSWLWDDKSCKGLLQGWTNTSWEYQINPDGSNPFKVYCDQTTDWGWWTRIYHHTSLNDYKFIGNLKNPSYGLASWNFSKAINNLPLTEILLKYWNWWSYHKWSHTENSFISMYSSHPNWASAYWHSNTAYKSHKVINWNPKLQILLSDNEWSSSQDLCWFYYWTTYWSYWQNNGNWTWGGNPQCLFWEPSGKSNADSNVSLFIR